MALCAFAHLSLVYDSSAKPCGEFRPSVRKKTQPAAVDWKLHNPFGRFIEATKIR
jgi:hypothetical protein